MLFGVSVITFFVSHSVPTDPVAAVLGEKASEHPEIVQAFRAKWGLDKPLPLQYRIYLENLSSGEWGVSIFSHRPVATDIAQFLPATMELATAAIAIGILVAIPLGIAAALRMGHLTDVIIRAITLIGVSMPIFWLALLLLNIFFLQLGWVAGPTGRLSPAVPPPPSVTGWYTIDSLLSGRFETFRDAMAHLALPALVLSTWSIGLLTRMVRSSMLQILPQEFVRTARSRGGGRLYVTLRHALPNAMLTVIAVVGLAYGDLLAGAVVAESIFSWPGIGKYGFNAATSNDFPAIMGVTLVVALIYLGVNLLVDVFYVVVDPRIRHGL
jgi:peptide/nickel transport system permease protein